MNDQRIVKLLRRIIGNSSRILLREVMETDSRDFPDMCDKVSTDTIIRCVALIKEIDFPTYQANKGSYDYILGVDTSRIS